MSLITVSSESADDRDQSPRYSRCSASSSVSSASSVMPMMPFIGVRISWLMLARNSLLARLAAFGGLLGALQLGFGALAVGDVARVDDDSGQDRIVEVIIHAALQDAI